MNPLTKKLSYSGLMAALCFVSTSIISFPNTFTGGYIHLGDALVLSSGVVLGKKYGALAAGIGSAMADIYLGYASWAPATFIIKALMAFIVGYVFEALTDKKRVVLTAGSLVAIWVLFTVLLNATLSGDQAVASATEGLIADGMVLTADEVGPLRNATSTVLLLATVLIPGFVGILIFLSSRTQKVTALINKAITFATAGSIMVVLYYATYGIMYGNWLVPIFSVPNNLVQYAFGLVLALFLLPITTKVALSNQG